MRFFAPMDNDFWQGPDFAPFNKKPSKKVDPELQRFKHLLCPSPTNQDSDTQEAQTLDFAAEEEAAHFMGSLPVFPDLTPPPPPPPPLSLEQLRRIADHRERARAIRQQRREASFPLKGVSFSHIFERPAGVSAPDPLFAADRPF